MRREIGDVWIPGVASDPWKAAVTRRMQRAYDAHASGGAEPRTDGSGDALRNAASYLLKLSEHTWGLSDLYNKSANWTNAELDRQYAAGDFDYNLRDWRAQRDFARLAAAALPAGHALRAAWDAIIKEKDAGPRRPALDGLTKTAERSFSCRGEPLRVDDAGALHFRGMSVGGVAYEALGEDVYNTSAFVCDQVFGGKPGSAAYAGGETHRSTGELEALYAGDCVLVARVAVTGVGAPAEVWTTYNVSRDALDIDVVVLGKRPTRFNEAAWVRFEGPGDWSMTKLGAPISFDDVVRGGSSGVHAADDARCDTGDARFVVDSLDAPALAPIAKRPPSVLLNWQQEAAAGVHGVAFNLWNNAWSTNYMFFYPYLPEDANASYHFTVTRAA